MSIKRYLYSMKIINELIDIVGKENILYDGQEKQRFTHIWKTDLPLQALAVVFPTSTQEVAAILKCCSSHKQQVIVHGGLTNLVGATQTQKEQLVMAMDKMNKIEEIDEQTRTLTAQSGAILETLIDAAAEKDLLLPLSFGAKGSAQIGGVVSTNAGGLRVFRYGMTRANVLGVEAVLPDGTIISSLKKVIKDNSGYDLKQLFIGAEGTLGIITKVILRLQEAPTSRCSALVGINDYEKVVRLLKFLEKNLGGLLTGYELMWQATYKAMTSAPSELPPPIDQNYTYYVFIECLGNHAEQDYQRLEELISQALENDLIMDGILAQTERELKHIWQIREDVSVLAALAQFDQHFDISLPISILGKEVDRAMQALEKLPFVECVFPFGHIADGNIHFIVGKSNNTPETKQAINDIIYQNLAQYNGSVSAEHGIGLDKKAYLNTSRSAEEMALMKLIKQTIDPQNILNPGRII